MTHKSKIKELVGRGLNSYHAKALQQIDRIEKKNKEQNHKINILTNKLDDDYITKTEEGSVISLEYSKEGMIYLDELQGNTLVNYCTDGSKELTLNDEINAEGSNVTLSDTINNGLVDISLEGNTLVNVCSQEEPIAITKSYAVENTNHIPLQGEYDGKCRPIIKGNTLVNYCVDGAKELTLNDEINAEGTNITLNDTVDNGLVDVVLEGNTLVNIWSREKTDFFIQNGSFENGVVNCTAGWCCSKNVEWFKPNTEYTVITNVISISGTDTYLKVNDLSSNGVFTSSTEVNVVNKVGIFVDKLTTKSTITSDVAFGARSIFNGEGSITYNMIILEGDWTNKEIPSYFEGMKSVGELENNKIELMSNTKNIINTSLWSDTGIVDGRKVLYGKGWLAHQTSIKIPLNIKKGVSYFVSAEGVNAISSNLSRMAFGKGTNSTTYKTQYVNVNANVSYQTKNVVVADDDYDFVFFDFQNNTDGSYIFEDSFIICKSNDINEEFEYYKSNKKEIILNEPLRSLDDGTKDKILKIGNKWYIERNCGEVLQDGTLPLNQWFEPNENFIGVRIIVSDILAGGEDSIPKCDTMPSYTRTDQNLEKFGVCPDRAVAQICFIFPATLIGQTTIQKCKEWFEVNPTRIIYKLAKPTYEEISDVELTTYLDTTHISNNSTIPSHMKVKNTGYNAIIKPSTQYTVALDTNINEAVDITLGGTKITTTNNVTTITTPSTLTDDSLIIHGKGTKVSNAMILEGDLTQTPHLIPDKYIEGLKSSFEDKCIPSNLIDYSEMYGLNNGNKVPLTIDNNKLSYATNWNQLIFRADIPVKPNTTYTLFVQYDSSEGFDADTISKVEMRNNDAWTANTSYSLSHFGTNMCVAKHTTLEDSESLSIYLSKGGDGTFKERSLTIKNLMLLEGDYTDYRYTYDEITNHAGKYRVDYKVTGKNKFDKNLCFNVDNSVVWTGDTSFRMSITGQAWKGFRYPLDKNKKYTISYRANSTFLTEGEGKYSRVVFMDDSFKTLGQKRFENNTGERIKCDIPSGTSNINISCIAATGITNDVEIVDIQLEEGEVTTNFEKYKEYTKTFYLSSPLLTGDTIEESYGKATHVHRSGKVILDGSENWIFMNDFPSNIYATYLVGGSVIACDKIVSRVHSSTSENYWTIYHNLNYLKIQCPHETTSELKEWLQSNPVTVVYELASPIYETISEENILCDSYMNGHLDFDTNISINRANFDQAHSDKLLYLNADTDYILQFESDSEGIIYGWNVFNTYFNRFNVRKGINRIPFTTRVDEPTTPSAFLSMNINGIGFNMSNIQVVATDQNFGYFKGMYSVGQDDEVGHKIEILSQNKNLFNYEEYYRFFPSTKTSDSTILSHKGDLKGGNHNFGFASPMKVNLKPNTTYTFCVFNLSDSGQVLSCEGCLSSRSAELGIDSIPIGEVGYKVFTTNSTNYKDGISFKFNTSTDGENAKYKIMLVEGDVRPSSYTHYGQNKKEIQLSEPLRGLSNEIKDKFIKRNGKWYVERNCIEERVSDTWEWVKSSLAEDYYYYVDDRFKFSEHQINVLCDKFKSATISQANDKNFYTSNNDYVALGSYAGMGVVAIDLSSNKLFDKTVSGFQEYLRSNEINIIYPLVTPTYEEITDPILTTYLDTTHISNDSIISCNMQVKNTGYNAIIKPNTKYTVALDTDKGVSNIEIALGGAKVVTNKYVTTITTPSVLVDDSLRVYSKGVKCSNIRLLEGDKTNYIPKFFEGMKSCFEDKFEDNGTYKMEILSNNENLFDVEYFLKTQTDKHLVKLTPLDTGFNMKSISNQTWSACHCTIKLKPNTRYKISFTSNSRGTDSNSSFKMYSKTSWFFDQFLPSGITTYNKTFTTDKHGEVIIQLNPTRNISEIGDVNITNLLIQEYSNDNTDYIKPKQNKIQFSSIEPLRGIGDVKDKFVFKDGKLMIERNVGYDYVDGLSDVCTFATANHQNTNKWYGFDLLFKRGHHKKGTGNVISDNLVFGVCEYSVSVYDDYCFVIRIPKSDSIVKLNDINSFREWFKANPTKFIYELAEPVYEEVPFELTKVILEGYENGTLFLDTNIPPTITTTYAGETPIVKSVKLNKSEVSNNTNDINDNIVPYLMDMDYRVVCLQLEGGIENISMARLFGGTYEMLQRDIQSKRYSVDEYRYRLDIYLSANKITENEYEKLGGMLNE